jgi:hypothetical protein
LITMEKTAFISVRIEADFRSGTHKWSYSHRAHMDHYDRQQNVAYHFGWPLI